MAQGFVRPARATDAAEIARIQLTTWRVARILPTRALDRLDEGWMASRWRAAIEAPPSAPHRVLVAVEASAQDYLTGFLAAGPAEEGGVAEIVDLLVEPRWGRRGHGSRLLAAAVAGWRDDRFDTALAWAYERDRATQTFLASAGWTVDGATRALDVDDQLIPQVRWHVRVTEPDPP